MFHLNKVSYHHTSPVPGEALRGIEIDALDIAPTGVTAIIGPSGSGKTTLLSVLSGFVPPDLAPGGALDFGGTPMRGEHPPGRVAFVFQSPLLLGPATGLTNAVQGHMARRAADPSARIDRGELRRLLTRLGLADPGKTLIARRARQLSGGEAQRFAILRALMTDPQAILCDEPTSSLDAANADAALGALREWAATRYRPVVWVTHNLDQAAAYADHVVFMSGGRVVTPPDEIAEALRAPDPGLRLAALRAMSDALATPSPDPAPASARTDAAPDLAPRRYAHWIAAALSTDGPTAEAMERNAPAALAPKGERQWLSALTQTPDLPLRGRFWRRVISYSRQALALILLVLFVQIFAAGFFGALAQKYASERLEDPSVARIVFEHVVGLRGSDPPPLYPGQGMAQMQDALRGAIFSAGLDGDRAQIFGRRSIPNSALRFPDAPEPCTGWQTFDTVALSRADPLLGQTGLRRGDPALPGAMATPTDPVALLDARIVDLLRSRCGLPSDAPIVAEWAAGTAGTLDPLSITIIGAITDPPPLYPVSADMIVTEELFQQAVNLQDGAAPDPFRIATAYFPIDGFAAARAAIEARGYRIRDDSAAAVETLRRIARTATQAPRAVIALNLTGCVVLLILVIGGLLELNKRVFALFQAHGLRLIDILMVLGLHLAPALMIAGLALAGLLLVCWPLLVPGLPHDLGDLADLRNLAFLETLGLGIVAMTATTCGVTALWWHQTRARLTRYLQE